MLGNKDLSVLDVAHPEPKSPGLFYSIGRKKVAFSTRVQINCTRIIKVKEKKRYELGQLDNKKNL